MPLQHQVTPLGGVAATGRWPTPPRPAPCFSPISDVRHYPPLEARPGCRGCVVVGLPGCGCLPIPIGCATLVGALTALGWLGWWLLP